MTKALIVLSLSLGAAARAGEPPQQVLRDRQAPKASKESALDALRAEGGFTEEKADVLMGFLDAEKDPSFRGQAAKVFYLLFYDSARDGQAILAFLMTPRASAAVERLLTAEPDPDIKEDLRDLLGATPAITPSPTCRPGTTGAAPERIERHGEIMQNRTVMGTLSLLLFLSSPASALNFDAGRAQPQWVDVLQGLRPKAPPAAVFQNAPSAVVVAAPGASVLSPEAFFEKLAASDLVFVGERHDQPRHHLLQLEVLKRAHERDPRATLAMEMLDITQQVQLDDYLSGKTSDADFETFWRKAWGYPWEIYRPVFEYAKTNHIKARALNAPIAVVRQIAKGGLSSLTPEQRKILPAQVNPIRDPRYLEYVKKSLGGHGAQAAGWAERLGVDLSSLSDDPSRLARMLEAMAAWNETMGQSLMNVLKESGPVVVLAGSGHMLYDAGILESVRSRGAPKQSVVLPYPLDGEELPLEELLAALQKPGSEDLELGDYFWLLPK